MTGEGTTVLKLKEGSFRVDIITKLFTLEDTPKDHLVTSPAMGRDTFHHIRLLKVLLGPY